MPVKFTRPQVPTIADPDVDLTPVDHDRTPVASEGAEYVVAAHCVSGFYRGDRIARADLHPEADVARWVSINALIPLA